MKTKILHVLCFLTTLCVLATTAHAQGSAFTYQGRLNDGASPAGGSYDLRFAIYDSASGGTQQGDALTNGATSVDNGLFTVVLDFGNQFPGADRWLEIGVRTNGGGVFNTLAPRQQLTPTPYAVTAAGVASNAVSTAALQNASITGTKISNNQVVRGVNGLQDYVSLVSGGGITIAPNNLDGTITLTAPALSGTWLVGGNGYGIPLAAALGSTNSTSLDFILGSSRPLRLEHTGVGQAPNVIGGAAANAVIPYHYGGFIGGGGSSTASNTVTWDYGAVAGGLGNSAAYKSFVGGGEGNVAGFSLNSVAGGEGNHVDGGYSHIGGGSGNYLSSIDSAISGGESNVLTADYAFIGGGRRNTNSGSYAVVTGGADNRASGTASVVGGGTHNVASGNSATVWGGDQNQAPGLMATVVGGSGNVASGYQATTLGGSVGTAAGWYATTLGGYGNLAAGESSVAAGYFAHAVQARTFVFSTFNNGLTSSIPNEVLFGADQFTYRPAGNYAFDADATFRVGGKAHFTGPVHAPSFIGDASGLAGSISNALTAQTAWAASYATNAGTAVRIAGDNNVQSGSYNFIGAGQANTNSGDYASVAGGGNNAAAGMYAFVGGGRANVASGYFAATLGGTANRATSYESAVVGGVNNLASGQDALVAGGSGNVASGLGSAALAGVANVASGAASVAIGSGAHTLHSESFLWSSYNYGVTSTAPRQVTFAANEFVFRPSPFINYSFYGSGFNIGGNAEVTGDLRANRFIGDGAQLSNIVSTTALTANYANSAGTASSASMAPWSGLTGVPAGFADGIDNDTTYANGDGLNLTGTTFSLDTNLLNGFYWRLGGNSGTPAGTQYLGVVDNRPLALIANNTPLLLLQPVAGGTPNIVAGTGHTLAGGIQGVAVGGGSTHTVNANYGVIGGGVANTAGGVYSHVGGGILNAALGVEANVVGGEWNTVAADGGSLVGGTHNRIDAAATYAFLGGGDHNEISTNALRAVLVGGLQNTNRAWDGVLVGGSGNLVEGSVSALLGGAANRAQGTAATVAGGLDNRATGDYSTVPGGRGNRAAGGHSFAAGQFASAQHDGTFVWADMAGGTFASSTNNQFLIRAAGGVGIGTNAPTAALHVLGTVKATAFSGDGALLTGLNFNQLTNGTLPSAALGGTYGNPLNLTNTGNVFAGNGGGLTDLNAAQLTGAVPSGALTSVPAASLSGSIADARLSSNVALLNAGQTFAGANTFNNAANSFTGSGSGLTALNASQLASGTVPAAALGNAWQLGGNSSTTPGTHFLGTTDSQALEFKVNGARAFRLEPSLNSPNVIAGSPANVVSNGFYGALIAGGGNAAAPNRAGAYYASVLGGYGNTASGNYSVAMGLNSTASGLYSTAMGRNTVAANDDATAMGLGCSASGWDTVAMGTYSVAAGHYSLAAGYYSQATHQGTFVWSDSSISPGASSVAANSVTLRAAGGYRLFSNSGSTAGVSLAAGGTAWAVISDRNVKKDFNAVDGVQILEKLAAMPITQWHYQWESADATPHIGPMAQDFKAAFYPGTDDKSITTQEADGVALAAIQGLNEKVESGKQKAESELQELKAENAELRKDGAELKARLEKLERLVNGKNGGAK